jgi:hypothetical protein
MGRMATTSRPAGSSSSQSSYHNHLMLAEVTGRLTALLDAITDKTSP